MSPLCWSGVCTPDQHNSSRYMYYNNCYSVFGGEWWSFPTILNSLKSVSFWKANYEVLCVVQGSPPEHSSFECLNEVAMACVWTINKCIPFSFVFGLNLPTTRTHAWMHAHTPRFLWPSAFWLRVWLAPSQVIKLFIQTLMYKIFGYFLVRPLFPGDRRVCPLCMGSDKPKVRVYSVWTRRKVDGVVLTDDSPLCSIDIKWMEALSNIAINLLQNSTVFPTRYMFRPERVIVGFV